MGSALRAQIPGVSVLKWLLSPAWPGIPTVCRSAFSTQTFRKSSQIRSSKFYFPRFYYKQRTPSSVEGQVGSGGGSPNHSLPDPRSRRAALLFSTRVRLTSLLGASPPARFQVGHAAVQSQLCHLPGGHSRDGVSAERGAAPGAQGPRICGCGPHGYTQGNAAGIHLF